jgi:hypothetical protein
MSRKPALTLSKNQHTVEVYVLNVGETFERFGGSSRGLTVSKTASLITRSIDAMGTVDREWDLSSPEGWEWISSLIAKHGFSVIGGAA